MYLYKIFSISGMRLACAAKKQCSQLTTLLERGSATAWHGTRQHLDIDRHDRIYTLNIVGLSTYPSTTANKEKILLKAGTGITSSLVTPARANSLINHNSLTELPNSCH
jgi:hypothetical protein